MTDAEANYSPRTFDLSELVRRLREAGFHTDTRQYLTAHQLILALAQQGIRLDQVVEFRDVEKVVGYLAPVFCHSPEEQARFKDIAAQWLDVVKPQPPQPHMRVIHGHREKLMAATTRPVRVFVCMALLVMAATILSYYFVPVTFDSQVLRMEPGNQNTLPAVDARVLFNDNPIPIDPMGRFSLKLTRFASPGRIMVQLDGYQEVEHSIDARLHAPIDIVLKPIPIPKPPSAPVNGIWIGDPLIIAPPEMSSTIVRKTNWLGAAGIPVAAGLSLFLLLLAADHFRRQLVLKRLPVAHRPDVTTLIVADTPTIGLSGPRLRRLVGGLRRPRKEEIFELSALLTARATARSAGIFSPVWVPRKRMPEYIVLIERKSAQDHQTLMFDDFLKRLEQSDVAITRYYFKDDPRVCRRADDPLRHWLLSELTVIHHACRLIICTDTDLLFHPLTGAPAPWTAKLKQWPRRVLFTPQPPYHWTRREWALAAEGMVVLPATVKGIQIFAELPEQWRIESLFPAPYARAFPSIIGSQGLRWLDRNPAPDDIIEKLVRQLRGFLGPSGFSWLCACAVYPEINWSLTPYLAGAVFDSARGDTNSNYLESLPALARLPWFRFGYMPDWLRLVLMGQLSLDQEKKVRRYLEKLLEKITRPSAKVNGAQVLKVATWITSRDLLNTAPKDEPLADAVFVGFIAGASLDQLALRAPSTVKRMLGRLRHLPQPDIPGTPRTFWQHAGAWFRGLGIWHKNWLRGSVSALAGLLTLALTIPLFTSVEELRVDTLVRSIAFSPDRNTLASGFDGSRIYIWDVDTGQQRWILEGHKDGVDSVAFSPDGKTLASASQDKTIKLWDPQTGQVRATLTGHTDWVSSVAFSPDGNTLASASGDATIKLWDVQTGQVRATLAGYRYSGTVLSVAFSPDGKTLASASGDNTIRLWDVQTRLARATLSGHTDRIYSVAFSPDGNTLASASWDKTIKLWDPQTGQARATLSGHTDMINSLAFSPDSKILASASDDKSVKLWNVENLGLLRTLDDFEDEPVSCVAFNLKEISLAAGGGGKIVIWPMDFQPLKMDPEVVDKVQANPIEQTQRKLNLGYCCAPAQSKSEQSVGEVFRSDQATCSQRGGYFSMNKKEAEVMCDKKYAPSPLIPPASPKLFQFND